MTWHMKYTMIAEYLVILKMILRALLHCIAEKKGVFRFKTRCFTLSYSTVVSTTELAILE